MQIISDDTYWPSTFEVNRNASINDTIYFFFICFTSILILFPYSFQFIENERRLDDELKGIQQVKDELWQKRKQCVDLEVGMSLKYTKDYRKIRLISLSRILCC